MNTPEQARALARLQTRRHRIERELTRVERKIARAEGQGLALQERIASLTLSHRRAA